MRRLRPLLLLLLALALPAAAREWRITQFHANITVEQDASMVVTERITLRFDGQFNGIYRTIPIEYPGPRGTNYSLLLNVVGVTDGDGQPLKYEERTKGDFRHLKIYVPGAVNTTRVVNISYTITNGIRFFEDHDELYWNVTGNDWPVPIDSASAVVVFPEAAAASLRAQAFTGAYGDTAQNASATVNRNVTSFETTRSLGMRGGLTINVYVPKGILNEPSALTRVVWFLRSNPILFLPVFAFVVMSTLWHYKGRDPDLGLSVAPMYEPPKDMPPAEVGALVDDRVDLRDITAIIIDLAVRGFIRIEEIKDEGWLFDKTDYELHLLKPSPWNELPAYESRMLRDIFTGGGTRTRISSLKNKFYTTIPELKKDVLRALKDRGMYTVDPDRANLYRVLGVIVIATPFLLLEWLGWVNFFHSAWLAVVSIIGALIIVWAIGREMTAKTFRGVRTWTAIRGFQEFMQRVDEDRLRRMPMDTFEKYLAFAMALGVEERWAKAFEGIGVQPPQWYTSSSGRPFRPGIFTSNMQSFTRATSAAFVAAPRSSSGGSGFSGGGGGGFSGGGFGGGGGGAF